MARRSIDVAPVFVLLRHGDAGTSSPLPSRDHARRLTAKGRRQSRRAGRALVRMGLAPTEVWTSRLPRAIQTADEALDAAGVKAQRWATVALAPRAKPATFRAALAGQPSRPSRARPVRWLVGHEPHLTTLLAYWTGAPAAAMTMKKGAIAVLSVTGRRLGPGSCVLTTLLQPRQLKSLRRR